MPERIRRLFVETEDFISLTIQVPKSRQNLRLTSTNFKTALGKIQSTLVISKLKGFSETLRDIRTSTYHIFRIEENTNRTTKLHNFSSYPQYFVT